MFNTNKKNSLLLFILISTIIMLHNKVELCLMISQIKMLLMPINFHNLSVNNLKLKKAILF